MVSLCARLLLEKRESLSSEVREKLVTGSKEEALARAGTKYVPEESKLPTGADKNSMAEINESLVYRKCLLRK